MSKEYKWHGLNCGLNEFTMSSTPFRILSDLGVRWEQGSFITTISMVRPIAVIKNNIIDAIERREGVHSEVG